MALTRYFLGQMIGKAKGAAKGTLGLPRIPKPPKGLPKITAGKLARVVVRTAAPGLYRAGASGAEFLRALRGSNVKIRTQDFYRLWNEAKEIEDKKQLLAATSPDTVPPGEGILKTHRPQPYRNRYVVAHDIYDIDGNYIDTRHHSIYSDIDVTKQRAQEDAARDFERLYKLGENEVIGASRLVSVYQYEGEI